MKQILEQYGRTLLTLLVGVFVISVCVSATEHIFHIGKKELTLQKEGVSEWDKMDSFWDYRGMERVSVCMRAGNNLLAGNSYRVKDCFVAETISGEECTLNLWTDAEGLTIAPDGTSFFCVKAGVYPVVCRASYRKGPTTEKWFYVVVNEEVCL